MEYLSLTTDILHKIKQGAIMIQTHIKPIDEHPNPVEDGNYKFLKPDVQ